MQGLMAAVIGATMIATCAPLPRDPDGTLDRIQREGRFTVGRVAGATDAAGMRVLADVARATGARPVVRSGQLEPLLLDLEEGRLDLVVGGRFDAKTPWATRVTLGPPLDEGAHREHIVARNGENAWIMLVERAARAEGGA
ncbi:MAG: hypothetical protein JWN21_950 [Sphingomonas bacterium]|uniref:hypothetical protein n=1 Tax=Sphingomonas bacterium TaxID=1895847 RepID=UPI0026077ECE|nr:hypothetical protein [Sphingomonas bacterium]MDB5695407.1 hypothetical protein [Sphingomonas bacterium]